MKTYGMFPFSECHELIENLMVDERIKKIASLVMWIWQERYLPYCAMVSLQWSMRVMHNSRKKGRVTSHIRTTCCCIQSTQCNIWTTWFNMQEQHPVTFREQSGMYGQHVVYNIEILFKLSFILFLLLWKYNKWHKMRQKKKKLGEVWEIWGKWSGKWLSGKWENV